ncbi:MAG: hypothetical protein M5R42_18950 [Rhodocyclaceae bacterium]|nr:hypothetical protein [Rhodocyclaceae bacterium]
MQIAHERHVARLACDQRQAELGRFDAALDAADLSLQLGQQPVAARPDRPRRPGAEPGVPVTRLTCAIRN